MSKFSSKLKDVHTWTVEFTDIKSGKQSRFTCTNEMKVQHEVLMRKNKFVKDVVFVKAVCVK